MVDRRSLQLGAVTWAAIGLAVALSSLSSVNPDARVAIGIASLAFPAFAVLAATALAHARDRAAGALLLVSVATPTYFAWVINLPALVVGLALVSAPTFIVRATPALDSTHE